MDDKIIIEMFWHRSEDAVEALDKKYGAILRAFSQRILSDTSDVEECINDAYFSIWNRIPPEKPDHLLSYVRRIVRNISINRHKKKTAQKRNTVYDVALSELEWCLSETQSMESKMEQAELTQAIEKFLAQLSTENRVIFLRRYWYSDNYEEIAKRVGTNQKVISVRLVRIRKQLKKYLIERGVEI